MGKELAVVRTEEEKERDLPVIANLYARGWNMHQIADFVRDNLYPDRGAVTIRMVSKDIESIRKAWTESALIDFNEARGVEIAKLNALETAYWVAWEESRLPNEIDIESEDEEEIATRTGEVVPTKSKHKSKEKRTREGNFLFLQGVERCVINRCKILGLFEPEKFALDWRSAANRVGISSSNMDAIKETTVNILMQAITRQSGPAVQAETGDIVEGQFVTIPEEREEG